MKVKLIEKKPISSEDIQEYKNKTSKLKGSPNYKKKYRGQGK